MFITQEAVQRPEKEERGSTELFGDARGGFLPRHDEDLREPLVRQVWGPRSSWQVVCVSTWPRLGGAEPLWLLVSW